MRYSKGKSKAISNTVFVVAIAATIIISVFTSTLISRQLSTGTQGIQGPQGEKGETGQTGPTGNINVPIIYKTTLINGQSDSTYPNWADIMPSQTTQITVTNKSTLIIIFQTYLRVTWSPTTFGWARIDIRALVNEQNTTPDQIQGVEALSVTSGESVSGNAPFTGIFYQQVIAGTHNIKIQWNVLANNDNGPSAYALDPKIIVYALPV